MAKPAVVPLCLTLLFLMQLLPVSCLGLPVSPPSRRHLSTSDLATDSKSDSQAVTMARSIHVLHHDADLEAALGRMDHVAQSHVLAAVSPTVSRQLREAKEALDWERRRADAVDRMVSSNLKRANGHEKSTSHGRSTSP